MTFTHVVVQGLRPYVKLFVATSLQLHTFQVLTCKGTKPRQDQARTMVPAARCVVRLLTPYPQLVQ